MRKAVIIDDEKEFCQILKNYLLRKGFDVSVFYLLDEGLRAIEDHSPFILFMDNNLPDGLGWEKVSELRAKYPSLKIHLVSGYNYISSPANKIERLWVWRKPFSLAELDNYIK